MQLPLCGAAFELQMLSAKVSSWGTGSQQPGSAPWVSVQAHRLQAGTAYVALCSVKAAAGGRGCACEVPGCSLVGSLGR